MRLRRRTAVVTIAATFLPAVLSATLTSGPASAQAAAPRNDDAVQQLGACLESQGEGDLLLLIDRSGSLAETDPDAVRVEAAGFLLERLAAYAERAEIELDVAVSGFDVGYERTVDWQRLTPGSLPVFTSGVRAFADRDTGFDTDYVNALAGVRDDLRSRQRGSDTPRCQAQVWFSDGKFDVETRRDAEAVERHGDTKPYAPGVRLTDDAGATAAEAAGQQSLCRPGGVVDQLRANGTLTLGVGLGSRPVDFALMQGISSGKGGPQCGRPTSAVVGDFRLAADVDELIFALNAFGQPGTTTLDRETGVCPRTACATAAHSFVLDPSIRSVNVLAGVDTTGVDIVLRDPSDGPDTRFRYSGDSAVPPQRIAGQDVAAKWVTDKGLELDLTRRADEGWVGQWSVIFVDPTGASPDAVARTQLSITGDLLPALAGPAPALRSGESASLQLGLASEETGQAVEAASLLGIASISAVLVGTDGQERVVLPPSSPSALGPVTPVDLADVPPGEATLRLVLAVRTRGVDAAAGRPAVPGTQLADRQVDVPLVVLPPLDFPSVEARVDFGRVEGSGPFKSAVTVTGPGCVWVGSTVLDASPDGVGGVQVSASAGSPETCLRVAEGRSAELPLQLTVDGQGNGTAAGQVEVQLASQDAPSRALASSVAFVADLQRPVDAEKRLAVLLAALLLGIGLPVAFLYLARSWTSSIPGQALVAGQLAVQVQGELVTRDGRPFTFTGDDLGFVSLPAGGVRRLQAAGLDLRTRTGVLPTSAGYTQVTSPGDAVVAVDGRNRLPLAVHGSWVGLLREPDMSDVRVAVLLPALGVSPDVCARVAREVRDRLPELVRLARAAAADPCPPPGPTPGWSGGGGPDPSPPPSTWGAGGAGTTTLPGAAPVQPSSPPGGGWGASGASAPWGGSPST